MAKSLAKDRKLVSSQTHELDNFRRRWGISRAVVREAKKAVGPSRRKIFGWLILNEKIDESLMVPFDMIIL